MTAESGGTTVLGKQVSDLQSDVSVGTNAITGTLIYNEGWESGPLEGPGYYMALKFTASDWNAYDSVRVGLDPSVSTGLVEILTDPDKNGVFKIISRDQQKFVLEARKGATIVRKEWSLEDLEFEVPADSSALVPESDLIFQGAITVGDIENIKIKSTETDKEYNITGTLKKIDTISSMPYPPETDKAYYLALKLPKTGFSYYNLYGKNADQPAVNLSQANIGTNGAAAAAQVNISGTDYMLIRYVFAGDLSVFDNYEQVYIKISPSSGSGNVAETYNISASIFEV